MTDDDSSDRPPALLLAGVEEDDAPEHVKQDDGHSHEGLRMVEKDSCLRSNIFLLRV